MVEWAVAAVVSIAVVSLDVQSCRVRRGMCQYCWKQGDQANEFELHRVWLPMGMVEVACGMRT